MFPRRLRLSRQAFETAATDPASKRATSPHFSILISKNTPKGGCSVVVSKKVSRGAVQRHLLKRRIRSAVRDLCSAELALIVYARLGSAELPFPELQTELTNLLHQVGI